MTPLYLYQYYNSFGSISSLVNDLLLPRGMTSAPFPFIGENSTHSSILLENAIGSSVLSEFPGNCSALVLSRVQIHFHASEGDFMAFVESAIGISNLLGYALLFITGTDNHMKCFLEEKYGFCVAMENIVNSHSGRENFFLYLNLDKVEKGA